MLKILSMLLGTIFVLAVSPAQAAVQVGQMAPDFEAVNVLTGESVKLSDLKGKTVVLEWTNHKCPYVVKHYGSGNMQKIQKMAVEDYGVEWISIVSSASGKQGNVDTAEAVQIVSDAGAHPTAKILDSSGQIGKSYDAKTTPHMFVIGSDGTLLYKGAIDDNSSPRPDVITDSHNYVLAALKDVQAGHAVQDSSTAPYGCGVKY